MKKILFPLAALTFAASAQAAIIQFDLFGTAGPGLLAGNETPAVIGGTGGELNIGPNGGIFYDTDTDLLTVNVGWGTGNGFTDLSSNVTNQHIHGPTGNPFGNNGVGNFRQTAGIPAGFGLTRTSNSPVNGQISNNQILFNATQEAQLMNGQFYINIHTTNNSGGEVRGFLVAVPEPATGALAALGALGLLTRRRWQRA
jgi:hypothetical protein